MKRITIQVSDEIADCLAVLASACTRQNKRRDGATTHGPLDVSALMTMLAEDAGMVVSRPGSWEGSNMAQVFQSHGYDV